MPKQRIAIIDPVSSSAYLATRLRQCGIETIAILTSYIAERYPQYASKIEYYDYDHVIQIEDNDVDIIPKTEYLKSLAPALLIYGFEFSIPFADKIIQLTVPEIANDSYKTQARIDKYIMHQELLASGLPYAIDQIKISNQDLPTLREKLSQFSFPVYSKPAIAACTSDGLISKSSDSLMNNINAYFHKENGNGPIPYLIQELMTGREFCIDTVTLKGKHYIVGLCEYQKKMISHKLVPQSAEVIYKEDFPLWNEVAHFVEQTLTTLGYVNGFAHTEFFIRPDGSIKLLEVNCRISGAYGYINRMFKQSLGSDAIDVLHQVLNGGVLQPLRWAGYSKRLYIHHWGTGKRSFNAENITKLLTIASYRDHMIFNPALTELKSVLEFEQLYDSVGQILLFNVDKIQLQHDGELIETLITAQQIF